MLHQEARSARDSSLSRNCYGARRISAMTMANMMMMTMAMMMMMMMVVMMDDYG